LGWPTPGKFPSLIPLKVAVLRNEAEPVSMENIGSLPLGVAILAVLIGLFGFFVVVIALALLFVSAGYVIAGVGVASVFGYTGTIGGIIVLIIGLVILGTAVGLWNQELWALVLAIIVLLFYGVVEYLSVPTAWLGLAIVVLLVVYLAAVSSHFD
jgi:hypothetical protein